VFLTKKQFTIWNQGCKINDSEFRGSWRRVGGVEFVYAGYTIIGKELWVQE